ERGTLLNNLGGSDPRRRRRWAAEKPLKVGSLPPKNGFLRGPVPLLRRRLSRSAPAASESGHWKTGRKSRQNPTTAGFASLRRPFGPAPLGGVLAPSS